MQIRSFSPVTFVVAAFVLLMSVLVGAQALSAQGAGTPVAAGADAGEAHPAHIHSGTCEALGDVVFPLTDVTPLGVDAAPPATAAAMAASPEPAVAGTPVAGAGQVVAESTTEVEVALDDILAAEHAINVHESAENIQNYIACGDLTGPATDGELHIQLEELNDSGYTGEAHLVDNGDGTTTVTVTLMRMDGGTPVASPVS